MASPTFAPKTMQKRQDCAPVAPVAQATPVAEAAPVAPAAEAAQPARPMPDAPRIATAREAFARTIERTERLVELETAALQQYKPIDFADFNNKKSHALLELSRAMRALGPSCEPRTLMDLGRLRSKLEKNLSVLEVHLKAVRQVCALIARTIEDDDSDGTYTASRATRR